MGLLINTEDTKDTKVTATRKLSHRFRLSSPERLHERANAFKLEQESKTLEWFCSSEETSSSPELL
jgi:hypothetical protein